MNKLYLLILVLILKTSLLAQVHDEQIGSQPNINMLKSSTIFDLSDPQAVNIKVSVWGGVRNPGYYIIPNYTEVKVLISYAGGLTETAKLSDLRLYRNTKDSTQEIIQFNYEDLFEGNSLKTFKDAPKLKGGDIILIPFEQKFLLRDYLSVGLSALAVLLNIMYIIISKR